MITFERPSRAISDCRVTYDKHYFDPPAAVFYLLILFPQLGEVQKSNPRTRPG